MDKPASIEVKTRARSIRLQSVAFEKKSGEDKKGGVNKNKQQEHMDSNQKNINLKENIAICIDLEEVQPLENFKSREICKRK